MIKFLRNLLLDEHNPLNNKELHISSIPQTKQPSKNNRVVELIKTNPNIKLEELAKELGVSLRTIKSIVATLAKEGIIKRVDGKRYGHWEIV